MSCWRYYAAGNISPDLAQEGVSRVTAENAQVHITRFLRDRPGGSLYVAMGYLGVWGLARLQTHAPERPVTLIIGDTEATPLRQGDQFRSPGGPRLSQS